MPRLNSRPRLREKGSSALSAQQNSLLNKPQLLPAHYPEAQERRAPKLLHVGRRISGDPGSKSWRVAWTTSFGCGRTCHSSTTHGWRRAAASTSPCEVDGGRGRLLACDSGSSNWQDATL